MYKRSSLNWTTNLAKSSTRNKLRNHPWKKVSRKRKFSKILAPKKTRKPTTPLQTWQTRSEKSPRVRKKRFLLTEHLQHRKFFLKAWKPLVPRIHTKANPKCKEERLEKRTSMKIRRTRLHKVQLNRILWRRRNSNPQATLTHSQIPLNQRVKVMLIRTSMSRQTKEIKENEQHLIRPTEFSDPMPEAAKPQLFKP